MTRRVRLAALCAAAWLASAAAAPVAAQAPDVAKTDLGAVGGSGVGGVVVLEPAGERTKVSVALIGARPGAGFSAVLLEGTCAAPGRVVFPLGAPARAPDGADRLSATVDARPGSLHDSPHAVRVDAPSGGAVACGELGLAAAARRQRLAQAGADARTALARFTEARLERRLDAVLELLGDDLRRAVLAPPGSGVFDLIQPSNPCWYRYAVEAFDRPAPGAAEARVRVYEHQWMGDVGGTLPRSWDQRIGLAQTAAGWRVARLGPPENRREEPKEVHGPTTSACNAMRNAAGLWLVDGLRLLEGGRLPAGGGLPAWPTAALGAALVAVGRRLRSRGVARWGA